jgi:hypothetical protein
MSITTTKLRSLLEKIPEIIVTPEVAGVLVRVPAIGRSMRITASAVTKHSYVNGPSGERALLLLLDVAGVPVQAIVASTDLVFTPDTLASILGVEIQVNNAPPLVSFSEMMADVTRIEKSSSTEPNVDAVVGSLFMLRSFVAGARRLGIDCSEAESRLQPMWERAGLPSTALGTSGNSPLPVASRARPRRPKGQKSRTAR